MFGNSLDKVLNQDIIRLCLNSMCGYCKRSDRKSFSCHDMCADASIYIQWASSNINGHLSKAVKMTD